MPFALFTPIYGPLPGELDWRGLALEHLQARWSVLAPSILLHLTMNFTGEFLDLPDRLEYTRALWTVVAAIAVVIIRGPRTLTRPGRQSVTVPP